MKQKLKDLLKKKNKPTFDEAEAYFTTMTDAQKAAKKGGVTDEAFPIGLESPNFGGNAGLMNTSGFEPKLTRTKRDRGMYGPNGTGVTVTATPIRHINNPSYNPYGGHSPHQVRDQQRRISARLNFYDNHIIMANQGSNKPFFQGINPFYSRTALRTVRNPDYKVLTTPVVNPGFTQNGSSKLSDAMTNMISCIDLSVSGAQAAAKVMQVNLPKFMGVAGKVTPWVGIIDNANQLLRVEGFNYNDAAQLAAGAALIGFSATLGAPVVFVGGLGLFVWELAETYNNLPKN